MAGCAVGHAMSAQAMTTIRTQIQVDLLVPVTISHTSGGARAFGT
jgi:hypothetical protein